jgi:hypothetical protein
MAGGKKKGSLSTPDQSPGQAGSGRAGVEDASAADRGEGGEDLCPFCGSLVAGEVAIRIRGSRERLVQVGREGGRKLFGKARKEVFLQWFASTGNIGIAAEKAGVARQTVSKHRLSDPAFAAAYLDAIELGVPDLKAKLIHHLKGRPKLNVHGEVEEADAGAFDPQLTMQMLREQDRILAGGGGRPSTGSGVRALKPGRAPRVASDAEVLAALVKRLAAFGLRVQAEAGGGAQPNGT